MIREPGKKHTVVIGLGNVQEIVDQQVENYRNETKCFHHVRVTLEVGILNHEVLINFQCDECAKEKKTKEVLDV